MPIITPLSNGNYVADFILWNGDTGAVAWGNGTTGTTGIVSAANSLIGSSFGDVVGGDGGGLGGVTALSNGNYVVDSPYWNNDEGAVTWGNGATGVAGVVSSSNSLIGWDNPYGRLSVTALTNGNYVAADSQWNGARGVVTWGSGTSGVTGVISAGNSLVGASEDDVLGDDVTALTNGGFVAAGEGSPHGEAALDRSVARFPLRTVWSAEVTVSRQ